MRKAIGIVVVLLAIGGIVAAIVFNMRKQSADDEDIMKRRRRIFVETLNEGILKANPGARVTPLVLEGADEDGLVMDAFDCDYAALRMMTSPAAGLLAEIDMKYARCANGVAKLLPPWR